MDSSGLFGGERSGFCLELLAFGVWAVPGGFSGPFKVVAFWAR